MIDGGADRSFVSRAVVDRIGLSVKANEFMLITGFDGKSSQSLGEVFVNLEIKNESEIQRIAIDLVVLEVSPADIVLGRNFLNNRAVIDHMQGNATFYAASSSSKMLEKSGIKSDLLSKNISSTVVENECQDFKDDQEVITGSSLQVESSKCSLDELFVEFASLFDAGEIQKSIPNVEMSINTFSDEPIKEKTRAVKDSQIVELKLQIENLLNRNIITESYSPWSFPTLLVPKKNGKSRLCVDYRGLNKITTAECFPLPRIENILKLHSHKKVFSSLDCRDGFFHLRIRESDKPKTAFTTPFGHYQYNYAPFGLRNTPNVFQRTMCKILQPVQDFCEPFIDDILISSDSLEDHVVHVKRVFECLRSANLTLNLDKCTFAVKQVEVLGHVLTQNGIYASPLTLDKIHQFPVPKTRKEVQAFLGIVNYLSKFVQNLAKEVLPLRKLIRKGSDFVWRKSHDDAFSKVKELLQIDSKISFARPGHAKTIHIESDRETVAAVLMQKDGENDELLDCKSRTLSDTETRYSLIEREALALQLAFCKFGIVIGGEKVIVYTSVPEFRNTITRRNIPSRLARIVLDSQAFDYEVQCKKSIPKLIVESGETIDFDFLIPNVFVDGACVRNGSPECMASYGVYWGPHSQDNTSGIINSPASNQRAELTAAIVALQQSIKKKLSSVRIISDSKYLVEAQTKWYSQWEKSGFCTAKGKPVQNADLHKQIRELSNICNPIWQHVPGHSGIEGNVAADRLANEALGRSPPAQLFFISVTDDFFQEQRNDEYTNNMISKINDGTLCRKWSIKNGILFRRTLSGDRMVVPAKLKSMIMHVHHENPAFGGHHGEFRTFKDIQKTYWWHSMKKDIIQHVKTCHQCQLFRPSIGKVSGSLQPINSSKVNEIVGLDFVGPLPTTTRGNRFIIVCIDYFSKWVVTRATSDTTAERTAEFLVQDLVCQHGIPGQIITDQGAQFESRLFKSLLSFLKVNKKRTTSYHPQCNGMVERANGSIIRSLKKYAVTDPKNWDLALPLITFSHNIAVNTSSSYSPFEVQTGRQPDVFPSPAVNETESEYVKRLKNRIEVIETQVRSSLEFSQDRQKTSYDHNRKLTKYAVGSKVLVRNFTTVGARKFSPLYKGPFVVKDVSENSLVYLIDFGTSKKWTSVQHLREYYERPADFVSRNVDKSVTTVEESEMLRKPNSSPTTEYASVLQHFEYVFGDYIPMPKVSSSTSSTACNDRPDLETSNVVTDVITDTRIEPVIDADEQATYGEDPNQVNDEAHQSFSTDSTEVESPRFECNICGKALASNQGLKRHSSIHSKLYEFKCKHCGRGFATSSNCKRHERIPHPTKFVCTLCGYNFDNNSNLCKHQCEHDEMT